MSMENRGINQGAWPPLTQLSLPVDVSDLLARRLRKVHERLGSQMEQSAPSAFAELAVHYDQCGDHPKAYRYALLAADCARVSYRHQDAVELLRVAERNAVAQAEHAEVRVRFAQTCELLGRHGEAAEHCERAIEFFVSQGDRRRVLSLRRMHERLRGFLGEPARRTLGACLSLSDEARELGDTSEQAYLLVMASLAHTRLGERQQAEAMAAEAVQLSERGGEPELRAEAFARLAATLVEDRPLQSLELFGRALELYRKAGDRRGEARALNGTGVVHQRLNDWPQAERSLSEALDVARAAGLSELAGVVALNLGVGSLKRGQLDRAHDLFAEAFAVFSTVQHKEYQLAAVYNLAHLDLAQRDAASAAELYDLAAQLAERVGQSEVHVGSLAGGGLSLLDLGKVDAARAALRSAEKLAHADWFQGRELLEALRVRVAVLDGRTADAARELERALEAAEAADLYAAAWLVATCARQVFGADASRIAASVGRYAERVRGLGYSQINDVYSALLSAR